MANHTHSARQTDDVRARHQLLYIRHVGTARQERGGRVCEGGEEHTAQAAVHEMENQNTHNEGRKLTTAS